MYITTGSNKIGSDICSDTGLAQPAVMWSAHHCRVGYGGSKSASEGGFKPSVISYSGVVVPRARLPPERMVIVRKFKEVVACIGTAAERRCPTSALGTTGEHLQLTHIELYTYSCAYRCLTVGHICERRGK